MRSDAYSTRRALGSRWLTTEIRLLGHAEGRAVLNGTVKSGNFIPDLWRPSNTAILC